MIKYNEMKTGELIDHLYSQGINVDLRLIEAVVERGEEAASPLREALADEENWYEGSDRKFWIVQHALAILSLMRDEKALPLIFEMLPHAYFSDHQAAIDIMTAAISNYGASALPLCREFLIKYRGAYRDNTDYSLCRYKVVSAMAIIARADESVRQDSAAFICDLYEDETEDDEVFLSYSLSCPVALDPERGFSAIRTAYQRGLIDKSICGSFSELRESYQDSKIVFFHDLENPGNTIEYFYEPYQIVNRQKLLNGMADEKLYWDTPDLEAPAGFQFAETGNLVNPAKTGRNDPCPCGSGKKYKKCCGTNQSGS